MRKELFELTVNDLLENNIWYFPFEEGESETLVATIDESGYEGQQTIIATRYVTKSGDKLIGYIYFDEREEVKWLKPVVIKDESNLNLWTGIRKPSAEKLKSLSSLFGNDIFPLEYQTLTPDQGRFFSGTLEGVYFLETAEKISYARF